MKSPAQLAKQFPAGRPALLPAGYEDLADVVRDVVQDQWTSSYVLDDLEAYAYSMETWSDDLVAQLADLQRVLTHQLQLTFTFRKAPAMPKRIAKQMPNRLRGTKSLERAARAAAQPKPSRRK